MSRLTQREREVLDLVARGLPSKQIAQLLGLAEHTVKGYLKSTYRKLDVTSRTEAAVLWVEFTSSEAANNTPLTR